VCAKCFSVDIRIYSTCAFLFVSFLFCFLIVMFHPVFVMLILIYTCAFFDCQVDFDVDNVQRRGLVKYVWGIALYKSYYYYYNFSIIIVFCLQVRKKRKTRKRMP